MSRRGTASGVNNRAKEMKTGAKSDKPVLAWSSSGICPGVYSSSRSQQNELTKYR